jgi:hypothetical protein
MKKLLLLALFAMIMVGCEEKGYKGGNVDGFDIVIVDSCEYLIKSKPAAYAGYGYMAHKGNCKFCLERNRKMIKAQIDTALIETFD